MAYRYGDRHQRQLFPQSIEEYVPADAPVRAYDAVVNALDLAALGIGVDANKVGCPEYDPHAMLKLLVYGYSYGLRSSRKLERETHYNLSFIWLMGGLTPDHKTIAEFRRRHKSALKQVLRECAKVCIDLNLIEGNTLFVDGTKIRANAGAKQIWDRKRCEKLLEKLDAQIDAILSQCEAADAMEQDQGSLVRMSEQLKDHQALKSKVEGILHKIETQSLRRINTTDPDCQLMHSIQGTHASYNVQSVVDEKHGLIVNVDAVAACTDIGQFAHQIEQAHAVLPKPCKTACADSGYSQLEDLEKLDAQGVDVIVPSQRQVARKQPRAFDKTAFTYDRDRDCFICPQGHILTYRYTKKDKQQRVYRLCGLTCQACCHWGRCATHPRGRTVTRIEKEDVLATFERRYATAIGQAVYALRKQKVELPFGHIKRNLKVTGFLLRGLDGVGAESSLLAGCFNIARMIGLVGVQSLVKSLSDRRLLRSAI